MVTLDQKNVMSKLRKEELREIDGGTSLSGTLINAFTSGMKTILEIGRSFGTSIRRLTSDKLCEVS